MEENGTINQKFGGRSVRFVAATFRKSGRYAPPNADLPVVLFLASLSYSKLTFVKAIESQKAVFYINATMEAFDQMGGVTRCLTVDNTKAAVTIPGRIDPAVLNCSFTNCLHQIRHVA